MGLAPEMIDVDKAMVRAHHADDRVMRPWLSTGGGRWRDGGTRREDKNAMTTVGGGPPHIVVVGSYAVALVMRSARIPARGETVLAHDFQTMDGGKGSNQAIACARLGVHTTFIAAVGDDVYGERAVALLRGEGVETALVRRVPGVPTGAGVILVDDHGDNAIAVDLGANRLLSPDDIDHAEEVIASADMVLAQLEIPPRTALHAATVARRHGVRTILNPAPAQLLPGDGLACVDILTPNITEAQVLGGPGAARVADLIGRLRDNGAGTVVLTAGEQGAWIGDEDGLRNVPAYSVTAADTTGAGDAFSAALAVALAEGSTLERAVHFACAAGGFSVQTPGTVPSYATRAQLVAFMESQPRRTPARDGA
jgi:ribokinase